MKTYLSPTENHKHLMSEMVPSLGYDGGDGGHRFYADDAWPVIIKQIRKLREKTL